jgi:hypothetical protein
MHRPSGWLALAVFWSSTTAAAAAAQAPAETGANRDASLAWGGEVNVVLGPPDHAAFFNYTDYDRNALRLARLRLLGEWHARASLSILADLRGDSFSDASASAVYVRWRPWLTRPVAIQAGRIPPVVGAFGRRAYSRDNAVIGQPLGYQYLTSLRPDAVPATMDDVLRMRGRGWQPSFPIGSTTLTPGVPLVAASRWDTGAEISWRPGIVDLAFAVTRGSPAIPVVRDHNDGVTTAVRSAVRLDAVVAGVSFAHGDWLEQDVLALTATGTHSPAAETVMGIDTEWGRGPWLVRGEWLRASFDVPIVAAATTARLSAWTTFGEVRYRVQPRWQVGARAERLDFSTVEAHPGEHVTWDAPVNRLEITIGFRPARRLDIRAGWQHNWRDGGRVTSRGFPALSLLYWF